MYSLFHRASLYQLYLIFTDHTVLLYQFSHSSFISSQLLYQYVTVFTVHTAELPLIDYESWYYYISFHTVLLYQQLLVYVRIITLYTKAYQSAGSIFQCSTIILPDNVFQCFKGHICIDMAWLESPGPVVPVLTCLLFFKTKTMSLGYYIPATRRQIKFRVWVNKRR